MSGTQVQLWYNRFKEDQENINDDACPGCPSTSTAHENIKAVKKIILKNPRINRLKRLLMMFTYRSAHAKQFLRMF